ncbi:HAMP domain-containing protein [Phormidesmis priestleyi ULC007]|uniref:Circadian input-output histidine kinase CikA n=1 Tax=Phormidesmis priestleyi ULC007 TaxID=1920490 RepID=A0A2T1DL89_9CYAN|nr:response regulator [Phormidesmis priestleyi]PSB21184.1 HAMP domain-containing protein [Phormidesmis priestleyi ULC007]PZO51289.1 MAG: HAMP domain-containing protein [Phormidesmis priestleyi]
MLNRLKIGTKIGSGFALGLAIFSVVGFIAYRGTHQLVESARQETHTYQVLNELGEIFSLAKDAETGQRGYILTGEPRYLEPYQAAISKLDQKISGVRQLTADNPSQQRNVEVLEPLVRGRLAVLKEGIDLRRTKGLDASLVIVRSDRGKRLMDEIRRTIGQMEAKERDLLRQRTGAAETAARDTIASITYGVPLALALLTLLGVLLNRHISKPLDDVSKVAEKVGDGDLAVSLPVTDRQDEVGVLSRTINHMITRLRESTQKNEEQTWLKTSLADVSQMLQGRRNLATISNALLSNLAAIVDAQQAAFYELDIRNGQPRLIHLGSYAGDESRSRVNSIALGEGLVGQCALEKRAIVLNNVPSDYFHIHSALGSVSPRSLIVLPVTFEKQVVAVIELASLQRFTDAHLAFLEEVSETIGVALNTIAADMRTQQLLEETQTLAEELQAQQAELQDSNQQLEGQARVLQASEMRLQQQQEELQQSNEELQQLNEELEEKAELLEVQKQEVEHKNQEIEEARQALEEKAAQLSLSSRYKSEFLANMSHELRTPLNSLLILAQLLKENSEGNLSAKQVEYSCTIHSAGRDLLELINDILDLAKIESGTLSIDPERLSFANLKSFLEGTFQQVAQAKGLSFTIELDAHLPQIISTDAKRLQQILKNLLSNAFKFTERGGIVLRIHLTEVTLLNTLTENPTIAFSVTDTGIGIPIEQQQIIFEAFQQADGTTSRKYGGTGLGLSISRELAYLLGGVIKVVSCPGEGSTFSLYLPQTYQKPDTDISNPEEVLPSVRPVSPSVVPAIEPVAATLSMNEVADDRDIIQPGDRASLRDENRVLLIIEDDINFARILLDLSRQQGFKVLVALRGGPGLNLARRFVPDAILLDIHLPDMDGWTVLDRIKHDPDIRHIPIHIISSDDRLQRGFQLGAIDYLQKPISSESLTEALSEIKSFVDRPIKRLLVIEDDAVQAQSIIELIGNGDVESTAVGSGEDALEALRSTHFDCIILDLGLPDMNGFELMEQIRQQSGRSKPPIVVYTGKELTRQEETQLKRLAETIIVKDVRSPERLLDETALFLHRVQANLPQPKRQILEDLRQTDSVLTGKKVLIVDDDVRNIFAITSLLERYQMQVVFAENGRDGITTLEENLDVNIVLMDVMMPEMDGHEATRAIRSQNRFRSLPIISLTAKAMQGDREKCIEAGASDYITKPVDTDQLLSLLRVWLYR